MVAIKAHSTSSKIPYADCLLGAGFLQEAALAQRGQSALVSGEVALLLGYEDAGISAVRYAAEWGDAKAALFLLLGDPSYMVTDALLEDITATYVAAPYWFHRDFALAYTDRLLRLGHRDLVYAQSDTLSALSYKSKNPSESLILRMLSDYVMAKADEDRGDISRAIKYYESVSAIGASGDEHLFVKAAFRAIVLKWRNGLIRTDQAADRLEVLAAQWPGDQLGIELKLALVRVYNFEGRMPEAARLLSSIAHSKDLTNEYQRHVESMTDTVLTRMFSDSADFSSLELATTWKTLYPLLSNDHSERLEIAAAEVFTTESMPSLAASILRELDEDNLRHLPANLQLRVSSLAQKVGETSLASTLLEHVLSQQHNDSLTKTANTLFAQLAPEDTWASLIKTPLDVTSADILGERAYAVGQYDSAQKFYARSSFPADYKNRVIVDYLEQGKRPIEVPDSRLLLSIVRPQQHDLWRAEDLRQELTETDHVLSLIPLLTSNPPLQFSPSSEPES